MNDAAPAIPDEAKERRNKAIEFHNHALTTVGHDKQLAYRALCSAVTVDPGLASGFSALGNACADLKMLPASIAAFRRCLELPLTPDGKNGDLSDDLQVKGMINLAHRLQSVGRIEEAYEVNDRVIEILTESPTLDPEGAAFAWTNMSLVLSIMGRTALALEYAKMAFEKSQEPIIEVGLAFAYLFDGDFQNGLKHFEARFTYRPSLRSYTEYPFDTWRGQSHHGKTLFVPAEAGLGDSLSFTRFLGRAGSKVRKVIYAVQPELVRLMRASLRHWGNIEVIPLTTGFPVADWFCPVGSLPTAMGLTTEEIRDQPQNWTPQGDDPAPPEWLAPGRKLHVGIAWAGSPDNDIDVFRSIPFDQFLDLYRVPGCQIYSLQVGPHVQDLHAAGAAGLVRDLSPYIRDACDTVGMMRSLDLVIAVESFVPHLAASMGKETWVPLSYVGGDWRAGRSGDRPIWYANTRLVRQGADQQWGPVFDRIVTMLKERVVDA
jgi:tetratricopeptide (TPR) repeat protein